MKRMIPISSLAILLLAFITTSVVQAQCTTGVLWNSSVTPTCNGSPQTAVFGQYAGEYSIFNLTAGTPYTFGSTIGTDFITIATHPGNVAVASGTQPVLYTPGASGTYRVYIHTN